MKTKVRVLPSEVREKIESLLTWLKVNYGMDFEEQSYDDEITGWATKKTKKEDKLVGMMPVYFHVDGTDFQIVRLGIDRVGCFDKLATCPIKINPLDVNLPALKDSMDFLLTDEGFKASNGYDYSFYLNNGTNLVPFWD
jgi:hypothetical protein